MSASNYLENKIADLVFNATSYAGQSTLYVKLHLGDPGEDCTLLPAAHTTRASVTFGASSSGTVTNDGAASFTSAAATETFTYFSLWDASTNGNPICYGSITTPVSVTAGDSFNFAIGTITASVG